MTRTWRVPAVAPDKENRLAQELAISPLVARVLMSRGIDCSEKGRAFLSSSLTSLPSPFLLKDMDRAVQKLVTSVERKERVLIFGDYDVDGVTSTALLLLFLGGLGVPVSYYVPHRLEEGYGLNAKVVEGLAGQADLLITVDCGVTNYEEVALANSQGMDVIIVDHHETRGPLPQALAVLNPKQADCPFPDKELAAVGVCFHLAMALRARLREKGILPGSDPAKAGPNLKRLLYLVALGTIGDVAPLTGLNRILVKHGLAELANPALSGTSPGIKALKEISGIKEGPIESGVVAFALAPRLNAAGRIQDASLAVELLTCLDLSRAREIAQTLNDYNLARQKLVEETLCQAREAILKGQGEFLLKLDTCHSLVLASRDWHQGVLGIVASRLVEEFHRPAIVLTWSKEANDILKGSARSIPGFAIHKALEECADLLVKYGGHKAAAGLTIEERNLAAFAQRLEEIARARLTAEDMAPVLRVDALAQFSELSPENVEELTRLKPFGMGNPEPIFASLNAQVLARTIVPARSLSRSYRERAGGGNGHLKLTLQQGDSVLEGIGFNLGHLSSLISFEAQDKCPSSSNQGPTTNDQRRMTNLAYTPEINEWAGQKKVRLKLKALQTECSR